LAARRLNKQVYLVLGVAILISPLFSLFPSSEPASTETPRATASQTQEQTYEPSPQTPTESSQVQAQQAEPTESETTEPIAQETQAANNPLAELLAQLTLAPERGEGYDRDLFRHWVDNDGDGCNTRREVLILEAVQKPTVTGDCDLIGGQWYSVYDGVTTNDPGDFDIDHLIPLKEAWDSGAHSWTASQRRAFANDLGNPEALIAVTASSNRSKSDRDPADWLPPNLSYHCQYITDWMKVKIFWRLSVDEREFQALRRVAAGC
jgi:hypothetical protein